MRPSFTLPVRRRVALAAVWTGSTDRRPPRGRDRVDCASGSRQALQHFPAVPRRARRCPANAPKRPAPVGHRARWLADGMSGSGSRTKNTPSNRLGTGHEWRRCETHPLLCGYRRRHAPRMSVEWSWPPIRQGARVPSIWAPPLPRNFLARWVERSEREWQKNCFRSYFVPDGPP
jgi:hypothetical protein